VTRPPAWLWITLLVVVTSVVFTVSVKDELLDFEVYRTAGARVVAGEPLYRVEDGHWQFKYLPAFAFAVAPLSLLPPPAARGIWLALSVTLLVAFVRLSLRLLPDRRLAAHALAWVAILTMGKFYVREIGLGQSNILLAVFVLAALDLTRAGREAGAGALLAAATVVKPYAILFWPYLVARQRYRAAASFAAVLAAALLLPAVRYGLTGDLTLLAGLWHAATASTAPNLAGQDNVSIAGVFAAWFGVGPFASRLTLAVVSVLMAACAWVLRRRGPGPLPEYLDTAVLLLLIPLVSPQGWDYVLLVGTPAVLLLVDRRDAFPTPQRWVLYVSLAVVGLSFWDVMGRELYRAFMMARVVTLCAIVELAMVLQLRAGRHA
jgi:hypothetical protein